MFYLLCSPLLEGLFNNKYKILTEPALLLVIMLLEYTGGNGSNYISVKITDADAFDSTKTHAATFV